VIIGEIAGELRLAGSYYGRIRISNRDAASARWILDGSQRKGGLTKEEKRTIGRPSNPRWEIDVVAYRASTNELLVVECKSYLDSPGVRFRDGFKGTKRLKLFTDEVLRATVFQRLKKQLTASGACAKNPRITLCLAAGHIASRKDREELRAFFKKRGWRLLDEEWILHQLGDAANSSYENDVAHVVAKLITRNQKDAFKTSDDT
jgi:hypothetical protein